MRSAFAATLFLLAAFHGIAAADSDEDFKKWSDEFTKFGSTEWYMAREAKAKVAAWKRDAEAGSASAQTLYADYFEMGAGGTKNPKEAAKWYRKAANSGNSMAMVALGGLYASGRGVDKNEKEAIRLYQKAIDADNPVAMSYLGMLTSLAAAFPKTRKWL